MTEQISRRIISHISEIANFPYGSLIAGKQGGVFSIQSDYYNVGLVTPPILRRRPEETIREEIFLASMRFSLSLFDKQVKERQREYKDYDNEYQKYLPRQLGGEDAYNHIAVYRDKKDKDSYSNLLSICDYIDGMPEGRWLFSFEAPVPEDQIPF